MTAERRRSNLDRWLHVSAALLGSLLSAVALATCLAFLYPGSRDARFAVGLFTMLPLWVTGICLGALCRSGARAWIAFAAVAAVGALGCIVAV